MVRRHGREMIQRMTRSQDSSFLCLLAIYAAHVVFFHVFDVIPFFGTTNFRLNEMAKSHFDRILFKDNNDTILTNTKNKNNNNVFEKGDVKNSLYFRDLQREQSKQEIFATFALSSSTWGIISGCAIFLLTNADPQNTL